MFNKHVQVCLLSVLSFVEMETINMSGHVGSSLTFECSGWDVLFPIDYYDKYLCKDPCYSDEDVILTAAVGKTAQKGRIKISDKGKSLRVTFTDLKMSDSKKYQCSVKRTAFRDNHIEVNLKVLPAVETPAETVSVGSSLSPAVLNSSSLSPGDVSVTSSTLHMTTNTSAKQGPGKIPYLTVGLLLVITTLLLLLVFMKRVMKKKKSALRRIDQLQEDAQTDVVYNEIRLEDQHTGRQSAARLSTTDNLHANYSVLQYSESAANCENKHVSSVSSCASKVVQNAACVENRAANLLIDSVYSVVQCPQYTEQPGTNEGVYTLAHLPQAP